MRIRYHFLGGHIHCRVFTSRTRDQTFAKAGDLIFTESEWPSVRSLLESRRIEILRDDEDPPPVPRLSKFKRLIAMLLVVSGGGSPR